jgi:sulfatase maturation enzyme AslB (radical SAM superfamily)
MFDKTFCSSPWFHVRLTYDGSFESCRWAKNPTRTSSLEKQTLLQYYNSDQMRVLRQQLLVGKQPEHCRTCYYEESFGKFNGRQRQLLKSAIDVDNFDLTLRSSPHYENFKYSLDNDGLANLAPVDLQIELGNTCNSACIMCSPEASSRLESDYHKLNLIDSKLFLKPESYTTWTRDPALVNKFVAELLDISNLRYIHFLGGETLYEPAFYTICESLIEHGIAKNIIVGTTTNGTIYNSRVQNLIENFKQFHLGISLESVTQLNDYVRWPSSIDSVLSNIDKFLALRNTCSDLYISLRITPNVFTVSELDKLFVYMIDKHVIAESCNILHEPSHLRMELMPDNIRAEIKQKLAVLIDQYQLAKEPVSNVRRSDQIDQVIANTVLDYYQFICSYELPQDSEQSRKHLVKAIKAFESLRGNSILDYTTNYEKFLRYYGY